MWVEHLIVLKNDAKKNARKEKERDKDCGEKQQKILMVFFAWVVSNAKNKDSLL